MSSGAVNAAPATPRGSALIHPVILLLAALIAVTPLLLRGPSCGDDFGFHVTSWLDAQHSWRLGIPYPHWAPSANFGAGEPRFVFYPPLIWMLGAALGLVLPWHSVPIALTFLLLAATGFANRALAREVLSDGAATLAGCAAIFFGYALYTAYERTAFAELSGGFWIPLTLLFLLRDPNPACGVLPRAFDGSTLPLALLLAGSWLSNAPLGIMACYLVVSLALVSTALAHSFAPLLRAATATALGLALAAVYLVPAASEQRWVDIHQATNMPGMHIEENWLFEKLNNPLIWWHDRELFYASLTAVAMLAIAFAGIILTYRRGRLPARRSWWMPMALIPPVVLLLQFPASRLIWNTLPNLRFLQFPWRWLVVLEAPMALFFAAGIFPAKSQRRGAALPALRIAAGIVLFTAATVAAAHSFYVACSNTRSISALEASYTSGNGFFGTPEYAPLGSTNLPAHLPGACLETGSSGPWHENGCDQVFPWGGIQGRAGAELFELSATAQSAGKLILPLRSYPAWQVSVNGRGIDLKPAEANGLIGVEVPSGPIMVSVCWIATPDVLAGRAFSLAALFLLILVGWLERRYSRVHLSS